MTRARWEYGASIGIWTAPQAIVNGVMLDEYPDTADAWRTILESILKPLQ